MLDGFSFYLLSCIPQNSWQAWGLGSVHWGRALGVHWACTVISIVEQDMRLLCTGTKLRDKEHVWVTQTKVDNKQHTWVSQSHGQASRLFHATELSVHLPQ